MSLSVQIGAGFTEVAKHINLLTQTATTDRAAFNAQAAALQSAIDAIDLTAIIDDDASTSTDKTWSINKITSEISAQVAAVINNAPEALDTLGEIATLLQNNDAGLATLISDLTSCVRVDSVQSFSEAQQTQARANIGAAAASEFSAFVLSVGDVTADFVGMFNATLTAGTLPA